MFPHTHTQAKVKLIHAFTKLFAILLFGGSVFFFSVKTATANHSKFDFPETFTKADEVAIQNSNGRYQMAITSINNADTGNTFWYILAWDTQTGRSKYYYGSVKEGTNAAAGKYQLPSRPL